MRTEGVVLSLLQYSEKSHYLCFWGVKTSWVMGLEIFLESGITAEVNWECWWRLYFGLLLQVIS